MHIWMINMELKFKRSTLKQLKHYKKKKVLNNCIYVGRIEDKSKVYN